MIVHEQLESGELVQVLTGLLEAENRVSIVYPEREFVPAHVRAFAEALTGWFPQLESSFRKKVAASAPRKKAARKRRTQG